MTAEVLACPSCRAPGPTGPDANGEYLCIYCGTRFHRPQAAAAAAAAQPVVVNVTAAAQPSGSAVAVVLGVVVLMLVALGMAGWFMMRSSDSSSAPQASSASASASSRSTSTSSSVRVPASPGAPTTVSAPVSVDVPVAQPPEPEAPATATFEFHRTQSGYQTSFYVLGYVTNTSPFVIDKPKVTVVLLDTDGKEVGTHNGYAQRDVLAPDERSPIKILINDPPAYEQLQFEVVPRKASYIPKQAEGLRIEANPPRPASYGKFNYEVEGKVFNEGSSPAKFVQIEIQAFGADGKLVGVDQTYADGEVLAPGGSARFKSTTMLADTPDHFEFAVSNRVAD